MSRLDQLKLATSLSDLGPILGYRPRSISYILFKIPDANKYTTFDIPKASGGIRTIKSPHPLLKGLQSSLANLLDECECEIRANITQPIVSHAFLKGRSICTNAKAHRNRRHVLNIDLTDFFGSINFGRVRGFFISNRNYKLNPDVATVIAQIAIHDNSLPQGSPCSPIVSNIIGHLLDMRLLRMSYDLKLTYSRYADDLTFSTNAKIFPSFMGGFSTAEDAMSDWIASDDLKKLILKTGFNINPAKTRLHFRGSRQQVTGLVVNKTVNVRSEYYKGARAMCHALFQTGEFSWSETRGLPLPTPLIPSGKPSVAQLVGVVDHVYRVKNMFDHRKPDEKKRAQIGVRVLYRRLLFYRNFVAPVWPLILVEGKTDVIYVRSAMLRLAALHPSLVKTVGGKTTTAPQFMNYTRNIHDVLQLGGGTGDFKFFIIDYKKNMAEYGVKPEFPVIMLIDNDHGAKDIFTVLKNIHGTPPNLLSAEPFYHVTDNLYLIKTPEIAPTGLSCIEDLFDANTLSAVLAGKTFNYKGGFDAKKHYGKAPFAENVIWPNKGSIEFSAFSPLLNRIKAAIDDYATKV